MAFSSTALQQTTLYKFRYLVGYGFIFVLLLFIISADLGNVPNGLSEAEMQQAVASTSMHFGWNMDWVVNGIFNFIQKVSVEAFGLSRLSLVLPSLLFGFFTIGLFSLTMRHWFRDSVAVVATVITMTSIPFTTMMRSATPEIMLPFWTMVLLYGAVRLLVNREKSFGWKLMVVLGSVGLLYTPYGIYALAPILISASFHPHVRSRFRHIRRTRLVALGLIGAICLVPLAIYTVWHPAHIDTLLGFQNLKDGLFTFHKHLSQVYDMYLNVAKNGFSGTQIIPIFNLATIMLALFGLLKCARDRFMARSYVLLAWTGVTAILILLQPEMIGLVFVPVSLLVAIGTDTLILEWYKLFPRNPYARVAGLIPLTILFLGIGWGNVSHYFDTYGHMSNTLFVQSLPAIKSALVIEGDHKVILVTSADDVLFYSILQKEYKFLTVTTLPPTTTTTPTFVLPDSGKTLGLIPSRIVTSERANDGVVLRIYRPQ